MGTDASSTVKEDRLSPWYILAETCKRQPQDRAIWTRERTWTFQDLHDHTVQLAQWMLDEGIRPGDLVALYLHNSAELLMLMFATLCIGAGPAMINYNLEGKALMHCLSVCETKLMIVDQDLACQQRINGSKDEIERAGTKIVTLDESLKRKLRSRAIIVPEDKWRKGMKPNFPYALIYTSGTSKFKYLLRHCCTQCRRSQTRVVHMLMCGKLACQRAARTPSPAHISEELTCHRTGVSSVERTAGTVPCRSTTEPVLYFLQQHCSLALALQSHLASLSPTSGPTSTTLDPQ